MTLSISHYVLPSLDEAVVNLRGRNGVYFLQFIPTGRRYIGESDEMGGRIVQHVRALNAGRHSSPELQEAWNQSDPSDWGADMLCDGCTSLQERLRMEQRFLKRHRDAFNAKMSKRSRGLTVKKSIRSNPVRPIHPAADARAYLDQLADLDGISPDRFTDQLLYAAARAAGIFGGVR